MMGCVAIDEERLQKLAVCEILRLQIGEKLALKEYARLERGHEFVQRHVERMMDEGGCSPGEQESHQAGQRNAPSCDPADCPIADDGAHILEKEQDEQQSGKDRRENPILRNEQQKRVGRFRGAQWAEA